jgi:Tol biopolymer transport system component
MKSTITAFLLNLVAAFVLAPIAAADEPASASGEAWLIVPTKRFGGCDLMKIDLKGQHAGRLTDGDWADEPCLSPDGKRLLFRRHVAGGSRLEVLDLAQKTLQPFENGALEDRNASWSPDGKQILFASNRDGNADVFSMNADGTGLLNLTHNPALDADPSWSPDGKKIAFASNRTGHFRLYVMASDGTELVGISRGDLVGTVFPAWSPDGSQIAFGGAGGGGDVQLFVGDAQGKSAEQLTQGGAVNSFASWSPDGQYIAYVHLESGAPDAVGDLMRYDVVEGTHTKILAGELPAAGARACWSP